MPGSIFAGISMDTLKITLIGGPTALLEIGGLRVLTDPTFDPPGSYTGAVTLTKLTGPALKPQQAICQGRTGSRTFLSEMDTNDTLETAAHFQGAAIVPVHNEGWQHFKQSQEDLVSALGVVDRLHRLRPGISLPLEI